MKYTDEKLRELCDAVESTLPEWVPAWRAGIAALLREVAEAPAELRSSKAFQRTLWESEAIAKAGMGQVNTEAALEDDKFRTWLAEHGLKPLPDGDAAKALHLKQVFERLVGKFKGQPRTPWLKILRLLAALYPTEFTTLISRRLLHEFASKLLDSPPRGPIAANRAIVRRLDQALGPVAKDDYDGLAKRMSLPQLLYWHLNPADTEVDTTETVDDEGSARLQPLPAPRRRKGLTAFKGYFQSMLAMLQEVEAGLAREDFIDFLRAERPEIKDSSHVTTINVLQGEFGVIHRDGSLYKLTPAGRAVLETGDPDELAPWLLTRVLGVDLALVHVRDHGPIKNVDLKRAIQKANPGWTGLFVPSAIVSWLSALDVIKRVEGSWVLTERGKSWTQQISWPPVILEPAVDDGDNVDDPTDEKQSPEDDGRVTLPNFEDLYSRLTFKFPRPLVAELHAGIWSNPCRHFAVLTGLSGAGKTQLARQYGLALIGREERARAHVKVIAVQPGWYDPGPLLGYINPIRPNTYVQTPVLEFLRRAVADPGTPYVLILDEMNLSHPEQYLAPLLSAMETGDSIDLHAEGDFLDGVECRLPYPRNLVLIGTVNMDETTHGLSDKVLDRAYTIEFWDINLNDYTGWDKAGLNASETSKLKELLGKLMKALKPARLHFGWRVLDDVVQFLARAGTHGGGELALEKALDAIIYAKIIPKLRGDDSPRFRAALDETLKIAKREKLKRCQRKLEELLLDLAATGSARFWR